MKLFEIVSLLLLLSILTIVVIDYLSKKNDFSDNIDLLIEKDKQHIISINKEINEIKSIIDSLNSEVNRLHSDNKKTIQRFSNEIKNIELLFNTQSDSTLVNAVIRYWADRIYQLPDFF